MSVAESDLPRNSLEIPSALEEFHDVLTRLGDRRPAVFLDYDGTLTPIVPRPEDAVLADSVRTAVRDLAGLCPVAVISGRDRQDVERLVGLDDVVYAGSHGFDIAGPAGLRREHPRGREFLPELAKAEAWLRKALGKVTGAQVERKRFAVAIHFRRVAEGDVEEVEAAVRETAARLSGLRRTGGKKIFELRPDLDWDKGKAVSWLMEELGLGGGETCPLFLGDDLTDEDAFRELEARGIGILVRDEERPTAARFALEEPAEAERFLRRLAEHLREGSGGSRA